MFDLAGEQSRTRALVRMSSSQQMMWRPFRESEKANMLIQTMTHMR
jgi:hypothetical protein